MTFAEPLSDAIAGLEAAGVPYMVTGSLASSYHGEPRTTRDIDIVIDPDAPGLQALVDELSAGGFYVDRDVATEALRDRTQFNAIGPSATKVDFIIRKDRPFSVEEFARRKPADLLGTPGYVATAEDVVLAKLEWAAATDSERQLRDAAAIVAIAADLDREYITHWAEILDVSTAWRSIQEEG